jgi:hypothetical protein
MKNWEHYKEPKGIVYFGYHEEKAYKENLIAEINNKPLTADQREKELDAVKQQVREHVREQNKPYNIAKGALDQEFWADAKSELGYESFLTTAGVEFLESKAYEDGHAYGFPDIFSKLSDLVEFAEKIIQLRK